ncbi:S41 family peptidase [Pedobacter nyackensis]|uniref:S41 family peptidase n=1 Tax=Pedobacter nyackensis TaxID=475255 RepID=UPI00292E538E|nr:S41 family peptidase [Pedobacter nyackensis]
MKKLLQVLTLLLAALQVSAQYINKEQKISNLSSFAKLYGYVRYFHPSDEAAEINWEKFAYYGIKQVENANTPAALTKTLNDLFLPIAPSLLITQSNSVNGFNIKTITPPDTTSMQEISWQHYGLGTTSGLYKSIRTNRPNLIVDPNSKGFGTVSNYIDAIPYRGLKVRLKSSIKTDANGKGQMWIRVDLEKGKMGFFNNMDDRPINNRNWDNYEIIGKINEDAVGIAFGTFLAGLGKVWTDNFSLAVEKNGKWIDIPIKNSSFEETEEGLPKEWYAKATGYKFEIVSGNAPDGNNSVLIQDNSVSKTEKQIFDTKASFGKYFTKKLGNGISCAVPMVLMGNQKATYPKADTLKLKKLITDINTSIPKSMVDTDLYTRLNGVIITWNVFQHFYPYQDEINTDWASQLSIALNAAYQAKSSNDYTVLLKVMTEKLKDGHIYVSKRVLDDNYNIPAGLALIEGKMVVRVVDSVVNEAKVPLMPGDEITYIDNQPALEKLEALKKEISGSEQWKNTRALTDVLNGAKDSSLSLRIKRDNKEHILKLLRKNHRTTKDTTTIKRLGTDIYLINISNAKMEKIKAMLPELTKAKGIICDLRGYPTNNSEFITHLLSTNDNNKWMFIPQIIYPDYDQVTYDGLGWNLKPASPHIAAKIIFLTGGGAISYAESYMGFIKQYKLATIVGQPTAGANGNVNLFNVPGNHLISFTGMKVKQQDGSLLQSIGIQPDVMITESINAVKEGKDEYMEKALELLK